MTAKRKRDAFSAHEKLVHKSCSLLQREAKKVRTFMVRRVVQQLKQLQQQRLKPVQDAVKQQKRDYKLRHNIERLEREHLTLKMLDLRKVILQARIQTGLDKTWSQNNGEKEEVSEGPSDDSGESKEVDEKDKVAFHRVAVATKEDTGKEETKKVGKQDIELEEKLVVRLLAHKQIVPLLDAIKQLVEKEEKEADKKRRAQEKRALKRGRHESLVGNTGRSGVVPTSLFLGSLSGSGGQDVSDELSMGEYGTMASVDDDIAEFLGEKKKKKNRPGQTARRMKAIRKEEALIRKENRDKGVYVPHKEKIVSVGKYGLSERPKKAKSKVKVDKKVNLDSRRVKSHAELKRVQLHEPHIDVTISAGTAHPSWLAKQRQKEKEKMSLTAFSGKKITF